MASQRNRIIIALIAILLVLGLGAVAYIQVNKASSKIESSKVEIASPTPTNQKEKLSIKDLLAKGSSMTCMMNFPEQNGNGTIYVSGQNFSGDFKVKVNGKDTTSHMIQKDGTVYMWTHGATQGTKIKIDLSKMETETNKSVDVNKQYDVDCGSWTVDNSKFTPPSDVKFIEIDGSMMMQKQSTGAGMMNKSVCDQITDATAKANCLKALQN